MTQDVEFYGCESNFKREKWKVKRAKLSQGHKKAVAQTRQGSSEETP